MNTSATVAEDFSELDPRPDVPSIPSGPRALAPLLMPRGSVRAILGLSVAAAAYYRLAHAQVVREELYTALMLVLGYYFAVRGSAEGERAPGRSPLWLPRRSIRFLLISGFVVSVYMLARHEQWDFSIFARPEYAIIGQLASFFSGRVVKLGVAVWLDGRRQSAANWFGHIKALACIAAAAGTVVTNCDLYDLPMSEEFATALPSVVTFYFGTR